MKKIKNKFIIIIIIIIGIIILIQLFMSYFLNEVDRNSYVTLINGKGSINKLLLPQNERRVIKTDEIIKTIGEESIIIIEWGDGSITRLGGDTDIVIKQSDISQNLSSINIKFSLLSGKTWSNVISFFGKDSYFRQEFNNLEAGVRGTIFNVDLDKGYINVVRHKVSLKNSLGNIYLIGEKKPFSIKDFDFIDLKLFIISIKDKTWEKYNNSFDKEYISKLQKSFSDSVDKSNPFFFFMEIFSPKYSILSKINKGEELRDINVTINRLNNKEKKFIYDKILTKYQAVHFSSGNNLELFKKKLYYKKALILLADKENKLYLIENTIFDLEDIFKIKNYPLIKDVLSILKDNKEILKSLNIDISGYIDNILDTFSIKSIGGINNAVNSGVKNVGNKIELEIHNQLNNIFGK